VSVYYLSSPTYAVTNRSDVSSISMAGQSLTSHITTLNSYFYFGFGDIYHISFNSLGSDDGIISRNILINPLLNLDVGKYNYLDSIGLYPRFLHLLLKNLFSKSITVSPIRSSNMNVSLSHNWTCNWLAPGRTPFNSYIL